ncbi:protein of unknown function (plasmid) [Magnetospirillum sp. XM-1]|nr:protein of unknown function [Magnetospirillum sp. XM-1]
MIINYQVDASKLFYVSPLFTKPYHKASAYTYK